YIEVGQKLIEAGDEPEGEEMFASALQHDPAATGRINEARTKARSRLWWSIVNRGANLQNSSKPEGVLIVGEALLDLTAEVRNAIGIESLKASQAWWTGIGRLYPGAGQPGTDRSRECDQLASYPFDPFRLASGVAMDSIKVEVALPACEDAVARYGSEARYLFQRGRVNFRAARVAETGKDEATAKARAAMAMADYEAAAAMGYPMAFNALALAYGDGFGMEKNPNKGADYQLQTFNRVMQCCWA